MGRGRPLKASLKAISVSAWVHSLYFVSILFLSSLEGTHGGEIIENTFPPLRAKQCDKGFVEVETKELLSYLGNISFPVPFPFRGRWKAVIKFTSPYTFIGGWKNLEIESFGRKAYATFNKTEDVNFKKGDLVVFQFRVLYGYGAKVPKVLSIKWQNVLICGPKGAVTSSPAASDLSDGAVIQLQGLSSALASPGEMEPEVEDVSSGEDDSSEEEEEDKKTDKQSKTESESSEEDGPEVDEDIRAEIQQRIGNNQIRQVSWKGMENKD